MGDIGDPAPLLKRMMRRYSDAATSGPAGSAASSPNLDQIILRYKDAAEHTPFEKGVVISFVVSKLWEDDLFYRAVANYALAADISIENAVREIVDGKRTAKT